MCLKNYNHWNTERQGITVFVCFLSHANMFEVGNTLKKKEEEKEKKKTTNSRIKSFFEIAG